MRYLWENFEEISARLKKPLIILLDFDGTIAPIANTPRKTVLPKMTHDVILELSKKEGIFVGIISGRSLADLKSRINIERLIYAGSHGLEGEIYGENYSFPLSHDFFKSLSEIKKQVEQELNYEGVFIEDKNLCLSLHFRNIRKDLEDELKERFNKIVAPYLKAKHLRINSGKKVIDIKPDVDWSKGHFADKVIDRISSETGNQPATIFIGDDVTDEDAFMHLNKDITIRVEEKESSHAKFFVRNIDEVLKFLKWIADN